MTGEHQKSPEPLVTVSAVGDGSLSVTDDNDIIVFGRPEQQQQKEAPRESSGKPALCHIVDSKCLQHSDVM